MVITTASLKKCRSLKSFAACPGSRNHPSQDDSHILEHRASSALPPPQPFVRVTPLINFSATVDAQAPYRILTASNDLCSMLDLSVAEMQGRSLHILFGPETDASAVAWAIKTVGMDTERQATIPAIKIYGRNGKGHLLEVCCVLVEKNRSVIILFNLIQAQHQIGMSRNFRNDARSRYNFITGLQIHTSTSHYTASAATPSQTPYAMPVRTTSVGYLLSGHNRPASISPDAATGAHYPTNDATSPPPPADLSQLPLPTALEGEPIMTATTSARAPFRILHLSDGLGALLDYTPRQAAARSIALLFGPETDRGAIARAVARAAAGRGPAAVPATAVYDRCGARHPVSIVCTARAEDGPAPACRLDFRLQPPAQAPPRPSEAAVAGGGGRAADAARDAEDVVWQRLFAMASE